MKLSRRKLFSAAALAAAYPALGGARAEGTGDPYLGQVATRCWIPQQRDTSNFQFNSRSWHFARDDISPVQIAFPNWYAVGANKDPTGTERGVGSAAVVSAAVEYPTEKFTRVTWGNQNSILV